MDGGKASRSQHRAVPSTVLVFEKADPGVLLPAGGNKVGPIVWVWYCVSVQYAARKERGKYVGA